MHENLRTIFFPQNIQHREQIYFSVVIRFTFFKFGRHKSRFRPLKLRMEGAEGVPSICEYVGLKIINRQSNKCIFCKQIFFMFFFTNIGEKRPRPPTAGNACWFGRIKGTHKTCMHWWTYQTKVPATLILMYPCVLD